MTTPPIHDHHHFIEGGLLFVPLADAYLCVFVEELKLSLIQVAL